MAGWIGERPVEPRADSDIDYSTIKAQVFPLFGMSGTHARHKEAARWVRTLPLAQVEMEPRRPFNGRQARADPPILRVPTWSMTSRSPDRIGPSPRRPPGHWRARLDGFGQNATNPPTRHPESSLGVREPLTGHCTKAAASSIEDAPRHGGSA